MRRPWPSFEACGNCSDFTKSLTVMSPAIRPSSSMSGSRSSLCLRSRSVASSREMPAGPVIRGMGVMTSSTFVVPHSATGVKRRSRLVTMPMSRLPSSTTGKPEMRYSPASLSSCSSVASGPIVTGFEMMPVWVRLTRSTWYAWSSIERLRWSTPRPPWRAIAIAMRDSVTVSIAADTSGTRSEISRVRRDVVSMSEGARSE